MQYRWPFTIADRDAEEALDIVANYYDHKYGLVTHDEAYKAIAEIYRLYHAGMRNPLLLANKAISNLERQAEGSEAA